MKKILVRFLLPLVITVLILFFFFRDISFMDIKENFLKIPLSTLLAFILLSMLGTLLRAIKYHILLSGKLAFSDIFLITLVRNFAVDLLPARSAALIFYTYLTKKKGLSLEEGASSFIVSVFYDGLALSFMLGGLVFFLKTGINKTAIYSGILLIFMVSVGMIFFSDKVIGFVLGFRITRRFKKIENPLKNIYTYLLNHKRNSERIIVFILSFFIRIIKYIFIYILFEGVVQIGWGTKIFSVFSFSLAITELSSLLPIQGLGGFGTWELAFAVSFGTMFNAYAISRSTIQSAGFIIHITTQVWEYFIGLLAFLYLNIKTRRHSKRNLNSSHTDSAVTGKS
jgi:uncharacterized membrane protein YbhN (UPF0104 family)